MKRVALCFICLILVIFGFCIGWIYPKNDEAMFPGFKAALPTVFFFGRGSAQNYPKVDIDAIVEAAAGSFENDEEAWRLYENVVIVEEPEQW